VSELKTVAASRVVAPPLVLSLPPFVREVLLWVRFLHAVFQKGPAVMASHILLVGQILADIHLVLLTHVVQFVVCSLLRIPGGFIQTILHEGFLIVSGEVLFIREVFAGLSFVLV
jgi:hypothetical protein